MPVKNEKQITNRQHGGGEGRMQRKRTQLECLPPLEMQKCDTQNSVQQIRRKRQHGKSES